MNYSPGGFPGGTGHGGPGHNGQSHPGGLGGSTPPRGPNQHIHLALDNMLRNNLRVTDPRDARQIADGLLAYYSETPQAAGIRQEVLGVPMLPPSMMGAPMAPAQPSSSDTEYHIANGDVEKALIDLGSNPLTNDFVPEIQGWGDSIRSAIAQGYAAARQGLDPTKRDMVMAMRRQLGEYARMARFVGSLSPGMTQNFRRLGRAIDEVSAVLIVRLGESMASLGMATGYYLLQVPLPELQQRRDAVIFALRNFNGGAQESYGSNEWPRGIEAYRRLYNWLEDQGQGDLRSLLNENELARTMDGLITRGQNGTAEGLRALGVTAQLDIERFRRMVIVAPGAMARDDGHSDRSPPLESFLQALELFAETFQPAGGLRLLRIARPPILLYGLYFTNQLEQDNALFDLISARGTLATIFDGLFPSDSSRGVEPQVLLDMMLLEFDRGIDLLALDPTPSDLEKSIYGRAGAFWSIIDVIFRLVNEGAAGFPSGPLHDLGVRLDLDAVSSAYRNAVRNVAGLNRAFGRYIDVQLTRPISFGNERQQRGLVEELQVQEILEQRWENLVRTVSIEAGDQRGIFALLRAVVGQAAHQAVKEPMPRRIINPLPKQYEQSLDIIARRVL
jgi:hypothetical protein